MKNRHEIISSAQLLMPREAFFSFKMSEASEADILLFNVFCYIFEQTGNAGDWCVLLVPIKFISHTLVVFTAYHKGMASEAFVIKERKYIDIHLELILV